MLRVHVRACAVTLTLHIPTFVEELVEALCALAEHCPDLVLLERAPADLQGLGQGHMHLPWDSEGGKGDRVRRWHGTEVYPQLGYLVLCYYVLCCVYVLCPFA